MPTVESNTELEQLGQLINEHCDRTGEKVGDFASRAGVPFGTISGMKNGTYRGSPSLEVVKRVTEAMNLRIRFTAQ